MNLLTRLFALHFDRSFSGKGWRQLAWLFVVIVTVSYLFWCFRFFCGTIGFFSLAEAAAEAYGLGGAGTDTHAAADAFGVVGCFGYIHIHLAHLCTFSAGNTFVFINFHSEK